MTLFNWRAVELVENYWIIQDSDGYTEYEDEAGDNLMFETKQEADEMIKLIGENQNA